MLDIRHSVLAGLVEACPKRCADNLGFVSDRAALPLAELVTKF